MFGLEQTPFTVPVTLTMTAGSALEMSFQTLASFTILQEVVHEQAFSLSLFACLRFTSFQGQPY